MINAYGLRSIVIIHLLLLIGMGWIPCSRELDEAVEAALYARHPARLSPLWGCTLYSADALGDTRAEPALQLLLIV